MTRSILGARKVSTQKGWMPVFIVIRGESSYEAKASPGADFVKVKRSKKPSHGKVIHQRIGTAVPLPDGSYSVTLFALPLTGKLILRPPRRGECIDPTQDTSQ